MIYLDNAATTPIAPEVLRAMQPFLETYYGNPAAKHYGLAMHSKQAVEIARQHIAALIGARPEEIVFTSSGSESNNFIIKGILEQSPHKHLVTTVAEHSSTYETAKYLESKGHSVTYLSVNKNGQIAIQELLDTLSTPTSLVSINWVNNEIGTVAPLEELADICKRHAVPLHVDATQAVGKLPLDVKSHGISYLSFSAHKIYGPKGIGACYINSETETKRPDPLIHGGGQEGDLRAGTLAVHNIVGFGEAAVLLRERLDADTSNSKELENLLIEQLKSSLPWLQFNALDATRVSGLLSLTTPGVNNEILLRSMAEELALSTGSACSSTKPSRVLLELGYSLDEVRSTIRVSIGRYNTTEEITKAAALLTKSVKRLNIF